MLVSQIILAAQLIRDGVWRYMRQTTSNVASDRPPPCSHEWRNLP